MQLQLILLSALAPHVIAMGSRSTASIVQNILGDIPHYFKYIDNVASKACKNAKPLGIFAFERRAQMWPRSHFHAVIPRSVNNNFVQINNEIPPMSRGK